MTRSRKARPAPLQQDCTVALKGVQATGAAAALDARTDFSLYKSGRTDVTVHGSSRATAAEEREEARTLLKQRLSQGGTYKVAAREIGKKFRRGSRQVRNWLADLKPQKRK